MGECSNGCHPKGVQSCKTKGAYFRCYCKENFTGNLCQQELLNGFCANGHECNKQTTLRCNQYDFSKSYYNCVCMGSYGGSRCEYGKFKEDNFLRNFRDTFIYLFRYTGW